MSAPRGTGARLDWALLACLAVFGIVVLSPVLGTGFQLVDDHEILAYTPGAQAAQDVGPAPDPLTRLFVLEPENGRTRPLYWIVRYVEIGALDAHPLAWHTLYLLLGVVAAGLLFNILRRLGSGRLPALLAGGLMLVTPGVSAVWIRLGPQESLGTLLILLATLAALTDRNGLFVAAVCAAALVKESFSLVAPALVALRLLSRHHRGAIGGRDLFDPARLRAWDGLLPEAVALGGPTLALSVATVVAVRAGAPSYGAKILVSIGSIPTAQTIENLEILAYLGGAVLPLLVLGWLLELRRPSARESVRDWGWGALVVLLVVVPQLVLYAGGGGFRVDRYVLPAWLGVIAGAALGTQWLRGRRLGILFAISATALIVELPVFALVTWRQAEAARADSTQLARAVSAMLAASPAGATVAIATDPVDINDHELAISFRYHLVALAPRPDVRVLPVRTDRDDPAVYDAARAAFLAGYFPDRAYPPDRGCTDLAAVAVLTDVDATRRALPCLTPDRYHVQTFMESVALDPRSGSLLQHLIPPTDVGYTILLRSGS